MAKQVEIDGVIKSLTEWAILAGIHRATISQRFANGQRGQELIAPKHSGPRKPRIRGPHKPRIAKPRRVANDHARRVERMAWCNMVHHCTNEKNKAYPKYGGLGIKVYHAWIGDFDTFFKDVGPRPAKGSWCLSRHDLTGDFVPGNTAWLPRHETHRNNFFSRTGRTPPIRRVLEWNGRMWGYGELAREVGIHADTIRDRYAKGLRGDDLVAPPRRYRNPRATQRNGVPKREKFYLDYKGEQVTLDDLAKRCGVSYGLLWNRYNVGDRDELLVRPAGMAKSKIVKNTIGMFGVESAMGDTKAYLEQFFGLKPGELRE